MASPGAAQAVDEGSPGTAGASISSLPTAVAMPPSPGRDAQHPPDMIAHASTPPRSQPGSAGTPLQPPLSLTLPPRASDSPVLRAAVRRVPRLSFFSPGKGRELPSSLPRVPQTSQETVTSSGCTEPAPDSWHRRDSWEPSPASSLLSPAHIPPSPGPLLCCSGHRAATLAQPHRPQPFPALRVAGSPASEDVGRQERRQVSDTAGDSREGRGPRGAVLPGMVAACRTRSQAVGCQGQPCPRGSPRSWQCPSPGHVRGLSCRGEPGCSSLPSASSCHGPGPL